MKIINILLSNKNGGVEDAFITHCEILQRIGGKKNDILAIVKTGAPYANCLIGLGIEAIEVKNNFGYYDFLAKRKISKIISNFSPNIVFAHVGKGILFAKKILHKQEIPLIAVNHSNNVKRSIGADAVLCVNDEIRKKAIDLGQNPQKTWTIPNVIKFNEKEITKIPYYNFSANSEIIIGTMARLIKEKGIDHLIKAIAICKSKSLKIKLHIAGQGKEKENLIKLIKNLDLQNEVKFLGWIKNKKEFFANINIFSLPSIYHETFGIVLLEAMKHKTPIIATDDIGPKSIIENEKNGLLITREPNEKIADKIAEAILKLTRNKQLAKKLAENGQKDLIKKFSYLNLEEKLWNIIQNV